jgi:hypothetical protein
LDPERAAVLQAHLGACAVCRTELHDLKRLHNLLLAADGPVDLSREQQEAQTRALLERCRQMQESEGSGAAPADDLTLDLPLLAALSSCEVAEPASRESVSAPAPVGWWPVMVHRGRSVSPGVRRSLPLTVAAVFAAVLLLVFVPVAPAMTLDQVLNAMARVRTAHGVGWLVRYRHFDPKTGKPLARPIQSGRIRCEWWYRAPDKFRREQGTAGPGWGDAPGVTIVNGTQTVSILRRPHDRERMIRTSRSVMDHYLTPLDFFTPEGLIGRAVREKHAVVQQKEEELNGRKAEVFSVEVAETSSTHSWRLVVDPNTRFILRAEWRADAGTGRFRHPSGIETVERLEYNVPVAEDRFAIPPLSTSATSSGGG